MSWLITALRKYLRHHQVVVVFMLLAVAFFFFPIQHYVTVARFQHWGICLFIWGAGFLFQLVASWRSLGKWGRIYLTISAVYVAMFGQVLYTNPWLDPRVQLETNNQATLRYEYAAAFLILGVILSGTWLMWNAEERQRRMRK